MVQCPLLPAGLACGRHLFLLGSAAPSDWPVLCPMTVGAGMTVGETLKVPLWCAVDPCLAWIGVEELESSSVRSHSICTSASVPIIWLQVSLLVSNSQLDASSAMALITGGPDRWQALCGPQCLHSQNEEASLSLPACLLICRAEEDGQTRSYSGTRLTSSSF